MNATTGDLLNPAEAAARLGISRSKLYMMMGQGEIASLKVGARSRRIRPAVVDAYIAAREAAQADLA
jgi:excisionase family DNA binding protein